MGIACTEPAVDPSAKSQSCTESRKIPRQELSGPLSPSRGRWRRPGPVGRMAQRGGSAARGQKGDGFDARATTRLLGERESPPPLGVKRGAHPCLCPQVGRRSSRR